MRLTGSQCRAEAATAGTSRSPAVARRQDAAGCGKDTPIGRQRRLVGIRPRRPWPAPKRRMPNVLSRGTRPEYLGGLDREPNGLVEAWHACRELCRGDAGRRARAVRRELPAGCAQARCLAAVSRPEAGSSAPIAGAAIAARRIRRRRRTAGSPRGSAAHSRNAPRLRAKPAPQRSFAGSGERTDQKGRCQRRVETPAMPRGCA